MFRYISLAALVASALCAPSGRRSTHVVHEKRTATSGRWQKRDRVQSDVVIPLRIGLTQSGLDTGYDRLMEVSHPSSEKYGKYLSPEEVHDIFRPSEDALEQVKAWLVEEGVNPDEIVHSENKGWIAVDLPASHVENLFDTEYYVHQHEGKGMEAVGCDEYSVPHHLTEHIDYIRPAIKFSTPVRKRELMPKRSESWGGPGGYDPGHGGPGWAPVHSWPSPPAASSLPSDLQNCSANLTTTCLRAMYQIPPGRLATPGYELGLFEQGDYFDVPDLNKWFAKWAPWVPQGTIPKVFSVDGGEAPVPCTNPNDCGESLVDIEITTSLIYPQKVQVYQVDDSYYAPTQVALDDLFNTFLDALDGSYCTYEAYGIKGDSWKDPVYPDPHKGGYKGKLMCGVYTPPKVISMSYGESEEDIPIKYAKRQCNEFMKLGLQGHSIFVSSGDYGVAQPPGDPPGSNGCLSNLDAGLNGTIFNPAYPSDCPFLTSVGATMLPVNATVYDDEVVMNIPAFLPLHFSSGGGFSNYYPVPEYQRAAVDEYFANHDPEYKYYEADFTSKKVIGANGGIYARNGRAFPDVAANGAYHPIFLAGEAYHEFGTSLSAPTFASVITLINEERAQVGKGPVGFVNPVLYSNAWALKDITKGNNSNCGTDGFNAVEGWDPVTGLGTPKYPELLEVFMGMP